MAPTKLSPCSRTLNPAVRQEVSHEISKLDASRHDDDVTSHVASTTTTTTKRPSRTSRSVTTTTTTVSVTTTTTTVTSNMIREVSPSGGPCAPQNATLLEDTENFSVCLEPKWHKTNMECHDVLWASANGRPHHNDDDDDDDDDNDDDCRHCAHRPTGVR